MADELLLALSNKLIAGRYAVDTSQVLAEAGGGLPAYLARDRMAVGRQARRSGGITGCLAAPPAPASPRRIHRLPDDAARPRRRAAPGGKGEGYFVVCTPPPGAPVSAALKPWPEKVLIDLVLRPAAAVLDILQARRLTHRAIRPNNVFQSAPGQPVTLGAAWAAPPAMHQPCVFESPYVAMCLPACRGDGTIADDVYALGVLLLTLSGGRLPMANMDDATVIRWKLDLGSFAALTRDIPLPGSLAELLRAMLAEDPDHRPLPGALMEHTSTRGRRLAARPARRSQNPLMLNDIAVFDARTLAYALFSDQKKAIQFLRNGLVTQWLRRGLGDASLATQIEDLVRGRMADAKSGSWSDPLLVMRTISALDHRMPLCWRGMALWPDALPSILAEGYASKPELLAAAEELLLSDILGWWSADLGHSETPGAADRQLLQSGGPGGLLRLFYGLNPLLPCRVPAMAKRWLVGMPGLMQFLEDAAESAGESLIDLPYLSLHSGSCGPEDRDAGQRIGSREERRGVPAVRTHSAVRSAVAVSSGADAESWRNGWRHGCSRECSDGVTGRGARPRRRGSKRCRRRAFCRGFWIWWRIRPPGRRTAPALNLQPKKWR